jgi:hypothetical protein
VQKPLDLVVGGAGEETIEAVIERKRLQLQKSKEDV